MGTADYDEPLTPTGRIFVRPEINQIINCVIGWKNPIDIQALKAEISGTVLLKQPKLNSLLVFDSNGKEHWRKTKLNIDDHFIIRHQPLSKDISLSDEDIVNDYLADLAVSSPLSLDKPLWEIHLLMAHKCLVLRLHHALGDGISLMSMFLTCFRKADDPSQLATLGVKKAAAWSLKDSRSRKVWRVMLVVWYTLVFVLEFVVRTLWVKDKRTAVSGGAGVELLPRKLATAKFSLDDMKTVKKAVPNSTLNDVLMGVISSGLSRYLDMRSPKVMQDGLQITGLTMANIRHLSGTQDFSKLSNDKTKETQFGNQFGIILFPITYHRAGDDPLQFVTRAKAMMDKKKQSLEAPFSYRIWAILMSLFGAKVALLLNYRILCNTTFMMSNMVGPLEKITIAGNPVTYIRVNSTSLPHALIMHMLSYAGRADMQISVAKDIIPDPKVLAKCLEESLLDMKEAAVAAAVET